MFDPTAYENIKVIVEGAVYDLDLEGHLSVIDRNDTFNLSKLTRRFDITFTLNNKGSSNMAKIVLTTEDLYKEINLDEKEVGCQIQVVFILDQTYQASIPELMEKMLSIWGNRPIDFEKKSSYLNECEELSIIIYFPRSIGEDQVDDLVELVTHCYRTLEVL